MLGKEIVEHEARGRAAPDGESLLSYFKEPAPKRPTISRIRDEPHPRLLYLSKDGKMKISVTRFPNGAVRACSRLSSRTFHPTCAGPPFRPVFTVVRQGSSKGAFKDHDCEGRETC